MNKIVQSGLISVAIAVLAAGVVALLQYVVVGALSGAGIVLGTVMAIVGNYGEDIVGGCIVTIILGTLVAILLPNIPSLPARQALLSLVSGLCTGMVAGGVVKEFRS